MGQALADLLAVAEVAIISGGDWPQFDKQVASRLPARAYRGRLWLLPTTGTKLYRYDGTWRRAYAELFGKEEKKTILDAFDAADRKSTRLNPVTNAHLVCRLLLEKKQ